MTKLEQVKAAIAEKFAPAIDMRAPYAKVMLDMAARAAVEALRDPTTFIVAIGAAQPDATCTVAELTTFIGLWSTVMNAILTEADQQEGK